jgi:energy-coupling factor transport system ATP-binding protein
MAHASHALEATSPPVIEFTHFSFRYGEAGPFALNDITLEIKAGSVVFIGGASGSGKSTLCNAISGQIPFKITGQMKGKIAIFSKDIWAYSPQELSERIGYVLQDADEQLITFTVRDEIAFRAENLCYPPGEISSRVGSIAESLGIASLLDRPVLGLSGGEKQKVIIAANLVTAPDILILDEPCAFLDLASEHKLSQLVTDLHGAYPSLTIIIIEHRLAPFRDLIDQVVLLDAGGSLAFTGPLAEYDRFKAKLETPIIREELVYPDVPAFLDRFGDEPERRKEGNPETPSTNENAPLIDMRDVNYSYPGGRLVLDRFSMSVDRGEFVGIIGENGAGKTTLLYLLSRVLEPDAGTIMFDGQPAGSIPQDDLHRRIGFIFQDPENQIFESTVRGEILFGPENLMPDFAKQPIDFKDSIVDRCIGLIHEARGASEDLASKNPFLLSWGQKRRLNLSSVLSYDPDIYLLDEPFIGQDVASIQRIFEILDDFHARGKTILLVTHDLELIRAHCSRVVIIPSLQRDAIVSELAMPVPAPRPVPDAGHDRATRKAQPVATSSSARGARGKQARLERFLARAFLSTDETGFFTTLHPLAKITSLVIFTIVLFMQNSLIVLIVLDIASFVVAWLVQKRAGELIRRLWWIMLIWIIYIPLNALFDATARPGEIVLFYLAYPYFPIRRLAFHVSFRTSFIIMALFMSAIAFTQSTSIKKLVYALMQAKVPYRFAFAMMVGFRYIPIIQNELSTIEIAQTLRGFGVKKGSDVRKIYRHLIHRITGLLVSLFRKIHTTSISMDVRAFGAFKVRTNMYAVPWHRRDTALVIVSVLLGIFGILYGMGCFPALLPPAVYSLYRAMFH